MAKPFIEITYDKRKLENVRRMLAGIPGAINKVMPREINRTAKSAKVRLAKMLNKKLNLTHKRIKQYITKPTRATKNRWLSTIRLSRQRVKLVYFGAKELKGKGVSYKIERSGGRKKIIEPPRSAFMQTVRNRGKMGGVDKAAQWAGQTKALPKPGHEGVFRRRRLNSRLPITELKGPSIGNTFEGAADMAVQAQWWALGRLEKNIDSQVAYVLNKWRASAGAVG